MDFNTLKKLIYKIQDGVRHPLWETCLDNADRYPDDEKVKEFWELAECKAPKDWVDELKESVVLEMEIPES